MKIRDLANVFEALKSGALKAGEILAFEGVYHVECFDSFGNLKWRDVAANKIVNAGLNHILSTEFSGGTQILSAGWYVGLTGATPNPAAADTMASHSGWTEVAAYSQTTRPAWGPGATAAQQVANASAAVFSVNGTTTVGGAFIVSNSTISGTTGTLFSCAVFSQGNKSCSSGDTVNVTYTITAASST